MSKAQNRKTVMLSSGLKAKVRPVLDTPVRGPSLSTDTTNFPIYTGLEGRKYSGISLDRQQKELNASNKRPPSGQPRKAAFLGPNGLFYDKDYIEIAPGSLALSENQKDNPILQYYNSNQPQSIIDFLAMPSVDNFDDFYEYEQAVIDWKSKIQPLLAEFHLPEVQGRSYYRPRVVNERQRSSSARGMGSSGQDSSKYNITGSGSLDIEALSQTPDQDMAPQREAPATIVAHNPWDTNFYAPEPDPDQFDTYEEYASAMKRWAILCQQTTSVVPPHSHQLNDIVPIQSIQAVQKVNATKSEEDTAMPPKKIKTGVVHCNLLPQSQPHLYVHPYLRNPEEFPMDESEEWAKLNVLTQSDLWELMDRFPKKFAPTNPDPPTSNNLLTKLHGVLPHNENKTSPLMMQNMALRRLNVAPQPSLYDCEQEIYGKKVSFKLPDYDITDLSLSRLRSDKSYLKEVTAALAPIPYYSRHDSLNSWNKPNLSPELLFQHRVEFEKITSVRYDEVTLSQAVQVLEGSMLLDKFEEVLAQNHEEEGIMRNFLLYLNNGIDTTTFPQLLSLFEVHSSHLIRAKISRFVINSLQSSTRTEAFIESLIIKRDAKSLSYLAYAMLFFSPVPVSIFELSTETRTLVENWLGPNSRHLVDSFLIQYYIDLIAKNISKDFFANIEKTQSILGTTLQLSLRSDEKLLKTKFWEGLKHRSSKISSTCLFFLTRLLDCAETVDFCLDLPIFDLVLQTASSKFSHTQFAARRLWEALFSPALFERSTEKLKRDWPKPEEKILAIEPCKNPQLVPLGLVLVIETFVEILLQMRQKLKTGYKPDCFLLEQSIWHNIWAAIQVSSAQLQLRTQWLAKLLAELSYNYYLIGALSQEMSQKTTTMKKGTELQVSARDLVNMYTFISTAKSVNTNLSLEVKANVLRALRYLIKNSAVFEIIRKDTEFFSRLDTWSRDSESFEVNYQAWKMFYQSIYYHNGVLDQLIKTNTLSHFFDLVGTGYHNMIMNNALHFVGKLYAMETTEQNKQAKGRQPTRGSQDKDRGLKSYAADVKALNQFFIQRSMFIKVHMIYKKFTLSEKPYYGATFLELAKFYHMIATSPACDKMYKDTAKKPEYKKGLDDICNLFGEMALDPTADQMPMTGTLKGSSSAKMIPNAASKSPVLTKPAPTSASSPSSASGSPKEPKQKAIKFLTSMFSKKDKKPDQKN